MLSLKNRKNFNNEKSGKWVMAAVHSVSREVNVNGCVKFEFNYIQNHFIRKTI